MYIYGLVCPDSGKVMYVGKSANPTVRYNQHVYGPELNSTPKKSNWLKQLKDNGKEPGLIILEECDDAVCSLRESYWIKHYLQVNPDLTNMVGVPHSKKKLIDYESVTIRFPQKIHLWIKTRSDKEKRSFNAQVLLEFERLMQASQSGGVTLAATGTAGKANE